MFTTVRRWLRNNRTPLAVGAGVIGAGYVATQYVLSRLNDAREQMSTDRIAKDNLRRRFNQNQEDCTFTVLALLPTATTNILEELDTEKITYEIQQYKSSAKSAKGGSGAPPSIADTTLTEDEGKSVTSLDSGVHASQITQPPTSMPTVTEEGAHEGAPGTAPEALQETSQETTQETTQEITQEPAQESIRPEIEAPKSHKTKKQLWHDLTISSITRAFTLLYTLALLTLLTRVQLNLLGRRSYLSSVVALATGSQQATISLENNDDDNTEQNYGNDFDINRKYLTFSWWLLNRGWVDLSKKVEGAVRTVFGALSPRDLLSFERIAELTMEVRKLVEGATPEERRKTAWLSFLLPPREKEEEVVRESGILEHNTTYSAESPSATSPGLRRLLDETADLIESPSFTHVLTLLLDSGFSTLVDTKLSVEAFEIPTQLGPMLTPELEEQRKTKLIQLPKILSVLSRQAHVIGNGVPNEYLQEMETVRELEAFAAVVYSSNWENEVRGEEGLMASAVHVSPADVRQVSEVEESGVLVGEVGSAGGGLESAWARATEKA